MKKKIFAALLVLAMLLSLAACGQKKDNAEEMPAFKVGLIDNIFDFNVYSEHRKVSHDKVDIAPEWMIYPNLSTAMLALEKGEVAVLSLGKSSADYLVAHNDKFALMDASFIEGDSVLNEISMLTTDTNTELYDILNSGIKQLKEQGTLDKLIAEDLNAYITGDPTPAELPKFDGAKTYKIAVTGDRPPMDFVSADGKAAGFNVALLSEIANLAQVNFEIIQVDSDARLTALSSGAADAVFWTVSVNCADCDETIDAAPEGTLITEAYFSEIVTYLVLK